MIALLLQWRNVCSVIISSDFREWIHLSNLAVVEKANFLRHRYNFIWNEFGRCLPPTLMSGQNQSWENYSSRHALFLWEVHFTFTFSTRAKTKKMMCIWNVNRWNTLLILSCVGYLSWTVVQFLQVTMEYKVMHTYATLGTLFWFIVSNLG